MFIIDKWRGQLKAIKKVFPNCNIVFCRIHLERNIRSTFGKYSRIGSLFNQLLNRSIKLYVYLNELKKLIDQSSKHKKVLQTLYNDFQSYCASYLSKLRLRGQYTTNSQEETDFLEKSFCLLLIANFTLLIFLNGKRFH